ncbi:MAG: hypothetical protein V1494_00180 [Candidatus Diapherotrites archaeon]
MPHERPMRPGEVSNQVPGQQRVVVSKPTFLFDALNRDIRALNSSVLIISQKINYLVRNEKILGRNLLVLNKKIKSIEESIASGSGIALSSGGGNGEASVDLSNNVSSLQSEISRNTAALEELRSAVETIRETYAKSSDVKELKLMVEAINPLKLVSFDDVEALIDKRLSGSEKKKK